MRGLELGLLVVLLVGLAHVVLAATRALQLCGPELLLAALKLARGDEWELRRALAHGLADAASVVSAAKRPGLQALSVEERERMPAESLAELREADAQDWSSWFQSAHDGPATCSWD